MITSMMLRIMNFDLDLNLNALQHAKFQMDSFHIWHKWSLAWEDVSHQAITLTSDIPTWRIKCPQSRKNCQIYPTKCRRNVMERKFLFSIISYWFSAWIKPYKPRFIMGENGGCWQMSWLTTNVAFKLFKSVHTHATILQSCQLKCLP